MIAVRSHRKDASRLAVLLSPLIAAITLCGCLATEKAAAQTAARNATSEVLVISLQGSCLTPSGVSVDLDRAMFLENRAIDVQEGNIRRRIRAVGRTFYAETLWDTTPTTYYTDVDTEVSEASPPDIELKLVYVEGTLALYWRETYQHRQYRQGLFHIEGEHIARWCEGIGGVTTDR
jgi:hypothetical protein